MTMTGLNRPNAGARSGIHIATIAYDGRIWSVHLEFYDDPKRPEVYLARLKFDVANPTDYEEAPRTAVIIIEETFEDAISKARDFDDHQLEGLLRSALTI